MHRSGLSPGSFYEYQQTIALPGFEKMSKLDCSRGSAGISAKFDWTMPTGS